MVSQTVLNFLGEFFSEIGEKTYYFSTHIWPQKWPNEYPVTRYGPDKNLA